MTWFKVDDGFWSHEKVIGLSPSAGWLWTRAGSYCAHQLTDGAVKRAVLVLLGGSSHIANELVDAGLWDAVKDGYQFHDWDKYQPTREEVESKRESWKERQRAARSKRVSRGDTLGDSERESASPVPSRPVPSSSSTKKSVRKPETRLPDDWTPNATHVRIASEAGVDGRREEAQFRDHAAANDRLQRDWDAAFRTWLRNARPVKATPSEKARRTVMLATELLEVES